MRIMEMILTVIVILGAIYFYDSVRIRPLIAKSQAVTRVAVVEPDIKPIITDIEPDIDREKLSGAIWDARRCLYRASQIVDGLE